MGVGVEESVFTILSQLFDESLKLVHVEPDPHSSLLEHWTYMDPRKKKKVGF